MRIALDAHGGDIGVSRNVSAVLELQKQSNPKVQIVLVGNKQEIEAELRRRRVRLKRIEIVHAEEKIGMTESAVQAVRRKTNNSISVAMDLLKVGSVDGMVSAGHSGAVVASALLTLGRVPGVSRPAIGTRLPITPKMAFALDIGAVIDPKPEVLLQYGYLGTAYAKSVLGIDNPTVALLSNGEESSKGNALVRSARELFEAAPNINFVGYVEGQDVLHSPPDVTVTDGFTGNVALKTAEGTAIGIQRVLRDELTSARWTKVLALMLRPAFMRLRQRIDIEGIGGAPLLGVNGVVILSHGRSSASALVNAIYTATHAAEVGLPALQRDAIPALVPVASDSAVDASASQHPIE